jgi:hypothetical protein
MTPQQIARKARKEKLAAEREAKRLSRLNRKKHSHNLTSEARKSRAHKLKFAALKKEALIALRSLKTAITSSEKKLKEKAEAINVILTKLSQTSDEGLGNFLSIEWYDNESVINDANTSIEEVTELEK